MSKLPQLKPHEIVRVFERADFVTARQKGSHVRMVHYRDADRYATIPMHPRDVSRKVLASILRQAKFSTEEFLRFL